MKVRTVHAHQSWQQHTLNGIRVVLHMIAIHEDALLRCMSMQIDVHEQIVIVTVRRFV